MCPQCVPSVSPATCLAASSEARPGRSNPPRPGRERYHIATYPAEGTPEDIRAAQIGD
jgi:hypothetical protein